MRRGDFYFDLPEELIAQYPSDVRGHDRLMVLGRKDGSIRHCMVDNLPDLIESGTLMVFNNSRVRKARVFGIKESTGRAVEFMFLNMMSGDASVWNTMVKKAKKQKSGMRYKFPDGSIAVIQGDFENNGAQLRSGFRTLKFDFPLDEEWFEKNGHIPLPPYIKRSDEDADSERYQNVYADHTGSAACPTAGLHFTNEMLSSLAKKGIESAFITLHVGLGTFLPVREDNIEDHKMHEEIFTISESAAEKINRAKGEGRPILAVGTTSVRSLESAANLAGKVSAGTRATSIFMYPGYNFRIVDQIFTNFHTPESTLIMLVSAFSSRENILNAYKIAVQERYRFFSYGDAMLIR